ncbi:MAG: 4-hydroxy-tetrahydrodipicolinate reductase [Planctomycetia bacterium]|nr:4-hydroxy-tetrahydrodipicolinate reductase [Planctomycetia bacterium]
MTTKVGIFGAAGRMGRRLIALGSQDEQLRIVAALDAANHPELGRDAGTLAGVAPLHLPLSATLDGERPDVLIDFSTPAATDAVIALCREHGIPLVYATTGATAEQMATLRDAASVIPVLWSPSMSTTVNLAMKLAAEAARSLKDHDADVEIIERHHRYKADAPSGTALKFGQLIAQEMGIDQFRHGREGKVGARPHNEIGYHAVRTGDNPGEHTIVFGLLGETLEITVRASNRDCYALGALAAAKFLAGQKPGFYSMNDVLHL